MLFHIQCFTFRSFFASLVAISGMDDEDNDLSPLHEMLDDKLRITYFKGYLAEVAQAVK